MERKTFTVSEINAFINNKLKRDQSLKNILVKGEISNCKYYNTSGITYFTLKDENSQIPALISEFNKKRFLKFEPENGMKVIVKGKIEVYEKDGKYQLYATKITEDGVGNLHVALEQLKKKLKEEGLFDNAHKKELPKYPKRIGVVTARHGSVIKDIISTVKRRYPICEILVFSTLVQGDQAAPQIAEQIRHAQEYDIDTLIVGRGGGSIEDLWPFNEEIVAREIYRCKIPVISAVGHETNFTISDLVADIRAPTPTAAGELAVPELSKVKDNVERLSERLNRSINDKITVNKTKLENITQKSIIKNPESVYEIKGMNLDSLVNRLDFASKTMIAESRTRLFRLENSYVLKNPKAIYEAKEQTVGNLINRLTFTSKTIINENRTELYRLENSNILKNPDKIYKSGKMNLNSLVDKLSFTSKTIISENRNRLFKLENTGILKNPMDITKNHRDACLKNINKLEVLDPLLTLKRGYVIAKSNDKVISSSKDVKTGDEVTIEFDDGKVNTKVI